MNVTYDDDYDQLDFEDGVRTMLQRLAADATVRPPAWRDLIERDEAVVLPLGPARTITDTRTRRRDRRPRVSLVAAAVAALVVAGVLVVDRPGEGPTTGTTGEAISAISPGDPSFDVDAAAAVWSTDAADPVGAAEAYLGANGVPVARGASVEVSESTPGTAVVEWTLPGAEGVGGTVFLRSGGDIGAAAPTWTVVGAAAPDVALADVRYDGGELSVSVLRTVAGAEQLAVGVWVNGEARSLGGTPVPQAGAAGVSLGELVDIGTGVDAARSLRLGVDADDVVTLRVVHVVDGLALSVTQMAVALPEATAGAAATAGTSATGADARAGAGADTGAGDASATAGAEAGGGETGVDAGVGTDAPDAPDATVPTLPPLSDLPIIGDVTEALTDLPSPSVPTTAPGPRPDLVP